MDYKDYVKITKAVCCKGKKIRYCLEAELDDADKSKIALVIMKNPSKADKKKSDQTINRVLEVMRDSGYGKCCIMNLIPYYGTDSVTVAQIAECEQDVYDINDEILTGKVNLATKIFVAWGRESGFSKEFYNKRIDKVKSILRENAKSKVYYYKMNSDGTPIHPARNQWEKGITEEDFEEFKFDN